MQKVKLERDLKTYREIRLNKFKGYSKLEKDWLITDLIRDYAAVSLCGTVGETLAFEKEAAAYIRALKQQRRVHFFASMFERVRESLIQQGVLK